MGSFSFSRVFVAFLVGSLAWNAGVRASTVQQTQDRLEAVKERTITAIDKNNEARDALAQDPQDIEAATAALNEARLAAFAADYLIDEVLADPPECDPLCLSSIFDLILAYISLIDLVDTAIANTLNDCGGLTATMGGASVLNQAGPCDAAALDPVAANLQAADELLDDMLALLAAIVPTVSEWGLVVMALLVVTSGTTLVRHRGAS